MQVFAFMIMAVSQLLFLEVAHANTIYNITKFRIANMDPVYHQVDIYFGELAARRILLFAGRTEFMVDTGSSINVQNPENKNLRPKGRGIQNKPSCGSECNC